jgi:class 3 adenylate cyclase
MRCTHCGAELISGKQFCHACGTRVASQCARCGAAVSASYRFCPDCGQRIGAEVHDVPPPAADERPGPRPLAPVSDIRTARGAIEGERKLVTVVFCDLVGSTAIAERLDPEDYHDLLDEYLEVAFAEIYRLDGIVNQLAGDGLMALFGAPVAHEDAPQRAVRAALGIHEALRPFAERVQAQRGVRLRARIGINTGPVVVGSVGNDLKMDYSAVGDTTNLAARLETLAEPGTTLISEATHRLVRGFFEVRPTGPLEVRGKREPVFAYEVLKPSEAATAMTIAEERGLTPLVGRDDEMAQLESAYQRLDARQPQVVAVVGDAGSGKSRLLYEFKHRRAGDPTVLFEGRCSSMSRTAPYHPFMTMLRGFFGIVSGEEPARAREKVAARLGETGHQIERRFPLLGKFMAPAAGRGDTLPGDQLKRETFEAVTGLVLKQSQAAPVVVLLEDVQWMDDPSRELLEALVARLDGTGVMVVLTQRPHDHPGWRTRAAFTQIVLRRLSDEHVTKMIRAIAGGRLPAGLEHRLVGKAEGSPFFAEELTNALLEEGFVVRQDGRPRVSRPVEDIPLPGTVQEVIAARLDRLPPEGKHVIQVAAVLGRQFDGRQLAAILDGEGIDVAGQLAELERRGLLHRKDLLSSDEYRFGESLTQEVAYESLLLKHRRQLHERIGLAVETALDGEANAERSALLAHHFSRSDNRPKALEALVRAGSDAAAVPSYRTAAEFYLRAWELAETIPDLAGADESLRRLAVRAIDGLCAMTVVFGVPYFAEAERAAPRGRELAHTLGDQTTLSNLSYLNGVLMMTHDREQFARGLALAEEGLTVAQRAGESLQAIRIGRGLGIHYAHDGRFDLARRVVDWVTEEMPRSAPGNVDLELSCRWVRELVLYASDDFDAARRSAAESYEMAERASNRTMRGAAAGMLAAIHFVRGEYPDAERWSQTSFAVAEEISNLAALAPAAAIGILSRVEQGGRPPEQLVQTVRHEANAAGLTLLNLRLIGEALLAIDDVAGAERYALYVRSHTGGRLRDAEIATVLGDVRARESRHAEARRAYAEAVELAEAIGARSVLAAAMLGLAELPPAQGEPDGAELAARALDVFDALGLERYAVRARALLRADVRQPA